MPFGPHPTDSAGDMRGSGTIGGIYIAVAGLPEFFSRDQGPARKYAFRLFEAAPFCAASSFGISSEAVSRSIFPVFYRVSSSASFVHVLPTICASKEGLGPFGTFGRNGRLKICNALRYESSVKWPIGRLAFFLMCSILFSRFDIRILMTLTRKSNHKSQSYEKHPSFFQQNGGPDRYAGLRTNYG